MVKLYKASVKAVGPWSISASELNQFLIELKIELDIKNVTIVRDEFLIYESSFEELMEEIREVRLHFASVRLFK